MKVELTYFRMHGKYYADGEYQTAKEHLWEIWDEVRHFRTYGILPGLHHGHSDYIVLVNVPDHPHDHPVLIGVEEHE